MIQNFSKARENKSEEDAAEPSQLRKDARVLAVVLLFLFAFFIWFYVKTMRDREQDEAALAQAKSQQAVQVRKLLDKWQYDEVVSPPGKESSPSVVHWQGKDAEVLFVDELRASFRSDCGGYEGAACMWEVWARSPNGAFFTMTISVDRAGAFDIAEVSRNITIHSVVRHAVETGRKDVLKKLGVPTKGA